MKLVHWSAEDLVQRVDDVLAVYREAMNYPPDLVEARRGFLPAHAQRPGFRAVATVDDDDRLLGFGYGYRSAPGGWWHEQVRIALPAPAYGFWLADCFELVELHVRPDSQGHGIGYRQLTTLLEGVNQRTVLLSTPEAPEHLSRAWRLYRRTRFTDVLRHFRFPGDERAFAVLGRSLPL